MPPMDITPYPGDASLVIVVLIIALVIVGLLIWIEKRNQK